MAKKGLFESEIWNDLSLSKEEKNTIYRKIKEIDEKEMNYLE